MKKQYILIIAFIAPLWLNAQLSVTVTINSNKERKAISPFIYSTNGQSDDRAENITGRRIGGNRLTSYNWENNFSNGGSDYINDNDNYLPWNAGLQSSQYLTPNIVLSAFHDTSLSMNCNSLITLPMAGYVARDGNGVVSNSQAPPSGRWRQVVNRKGSAFSLKPDTTDKYIYVDECMNNLISQFGKSSSAKGIQNYEMDNEWSIWNGSDPLMHAAQPTIAEAIKKSTNLASTIKIMDSAALTFGPVDYGYNSYLNFQNATDWSKFSSYGTFAYAYLHYMKQESDSIGHRLLDVYDIHYYSSAQGLNNKSVLDEVDTTTNTDKGVVIARMEAPRTLWDSTYAENSWIGQYYSPVAYIPAVQHGINTYYPGTKIGFTEYSFGGTGHISGGIALADMLGIAGRFGVYWCSVWGPVDHYWASGFKVFRNYDGKNGSFGNTHIYASTTNWRTSSVYSAIHSADTTTMNIVVMNKDYDSTLTATINISANSNFNKVEIYALTGADTLIHKVGSLVIKSNHSVYTLPKMSVYHFVLSDSTVITGMSNVKAPNDIAVFPNPSNGLFTITFSNVVNQNRTIEIMDITGKSVKTFVIKPGCTSTQIDISDMASGIYIAHISTANGLVETKKLIKE